ncbi:AMP-dependent synthetase [Saccharopolyspora sp. ASAGF58]|nr:AMP-dependent synthetase [Saccharopolyspora sp. ASAGF58]
MTNPSRTSPREAALTSDTRPTIEGWLAEYDARDADVAWLLCDRHDPNAVAFTFVDADLRTYDLTFGELAERSRRLATVLADHELRRGSRVPVLMGKRPELIVTLVAIWRLGAVHVPLFTAFATGAVQLRVEAAGAELVITDPAQRAKVDPIPGITALDVVQLERAAADREPHTGRETVGGDGTFLQLYTSGTTGRPKGVAVPVRAIAGFRSYMHFAMDVTADDVHWNAADPGWAYGLYYGIVTPLAAARRNLLVDAGFTPELTTEVLRRQAVTNFAGAPTMYRAIGRSGLVEGVRLRRACSAGEPLTPDIVRWARETLDVEIRDHYGQTELGMVIGNCAHENVARPLKDASMGQQLPGIVADVVDGRIAVSTKSPLFWFTGYRGEPERTDERFTGDGAWYLTGDTGRVDEDGYFFFTARDDDVILAAGYRIGPFDVESVLITHPAVADVAVVGQKDPDGVRGEIVVAYAVLLEGAEPGDDLVRELQAHVRERYSAHAYPRLIRFVDALPKTPSGKVQRFKLRELHAD